MNGKQFTRPADYFRDGFTDAAGELRAGINGEHSLGMAYRLLAAGMTADELAGVRKALSDSFESDFRAAGSDPAAPLQPGAAARVRGAARNLGGKAAPLDELFDAASKVLPDWLALARLAQHLERIERQMELIAALKKAEPARA